MEVIGWVANELGVSKAVIIGGAGGSTLSVAFKIGNLGKAVLAGGSFILAIEVTPLVLWGFDIPSKLDGAVATCVSIFGMAIVVRLLSTIQDLDLIEIVKGWFGGLFKRKE